MATLTTKKRNSLPAKDFALPEKRAYPINDRAHATNAKARATQMLKKGKLSATEEEKIEKKANKVLGKKTLKDKAHLSIDFSKISRELFISKSDLTRK
jgi:hypothetical protein